MTLPARTASYSKDRAGYYFGAFKAREYREPSRNASSSIRRLAWNPPGNRIALALTDKHIRVWNPERPELKHSTELKGHQAAVNAVAWDPTHSDRLASASLDGSVRLWDYRSKQCLAVVQTGAENVGLCWHPDGGMVAVATRDEKVHFISPITHDIRSTYPAPAFIHDLTFSHAGDMLLLASDNGQVMLFDYPSMEQMHIVKAHTAAAQCLSLDSRGAYCAVGGSDAVVGIWDTTDWICLRTVRGLDYPVRSLSFSFDGQYICAGSDESGSHSIDIIHTDTGEVVHTFVTNHAVANVAWHPTKYSLAYSGDLTGMKILSSWEK